MESSSWQQQQQQQQWQQQQQAERAELTALLPWLPSSKQATRCSYSKRLLCCLHVLLLCLYLEHTTQRAINTRFGHTGAC
jgi:hypothetical protein